MQHQSFTPPVSTVPQLPYASYGRRVASNFIDSPLFWATIITMFGGHVVTTWIVLTVAKAVWFAVMKVSPGRMATKTRVYDLATGQATSIGRLSLRSLAHIADFASFVGWFWPLRDGRKQTFADKIMETVVLRSDKLEAEVVPFVKASDFNIPPFASDSRAEDSDWNHYPSAS